MSTTSQSKGSQLDLGRAEELKRKLTSFVTEGRLKDEYSRHHQLFFELSKPEDEQDGDSVLDWFLYDWFDDQGQSVIGIYLDTNKEIGEEDRRILSEWEDSINSVFEIRTLGKNSVTLTDLENQDEFVVNTIKSLKETPFKKGQCIAARLLPYGDRFIFAGLQFIMPDRETALEALQMRRSLEALDSPENLEKAQQEQCSAFCELFGTEELTVSSKELNDTICRFQKFLLTERKDSETGKTQADRFREEFGRDLNIPDLPIFPEEIEGVGEITLLCDEFDGIVLLPDFNKFKRVFEAKNPDKDVPEWRELLWMYIQDPDIPIVAFERVAETNSKQVEKVLRSLLDDNKFSIEHLYAVLLHYKNPVEGLEDLEDDQRLWDLLNGNVEPEKSSKKPASTKRSAASASTTKRAAGGKKTAAKKKAPAKKAAPAKKTSAKKTSAKKAAGAKTRRAAPAKKAGKKQSNRPATKSTRTKSGSAKSSGRKKPSAKRR